MRGSSSWHCRGCYTNKTGRRDAEGRNWGGMHPGRRAHRSDGDTARLGVTRMRFRVPARFLVAVTALGLAGLALVLTPVPATRAATVDDCQASIIALRTTTATTPFLG